MLYAAKTAEHKIHHAMVNFYENFFIKMVFKIKQSIQNRLKYKPFYKNKKSTLKGEFCTKTNNLPFNVDFLSKKITGSPSGRNRLTLHLK